MMKLLKFNHTFPPAEGVLFLSFLNCDTIVTEKFAKINTQPFETGTGEILSDISASGRERPWSEKKKASQKLYKLFQIARGSDETVITASALDRLNHCAEHLVFKQCPNHSAEKHLAKGDFCRNRLCPICNWRKSLKMFSQMSEIVEKMTDDNRDLRFIFLTLTVKNCKGDELSDTIDQMNKAFKFMTDKTKRSISVQKYILGYFKALEVTYNVKEDTYHPHLHIVLAVPDSYFTRGFTKTEKWADIWQKCLGVDYKPVVNVQSVDTADKGVICEISKYATKGEYLLDGIPEQQAAQAVGVLAKALKSRRLVTFSGLFREVRKFLQQDDVEDGDLIHVTGEQDNDTCKVCGSKLLEHMYKWRIGAYVN